MEKQLREVAKHGEKERELSEKTIFELRLGMTELKNDYAMLNDIRLEKHNEFGETTKKREQMWSDMCREKCDQVEKLNVDNSAQKDSDTVGKEGNLEEHQMHISVDEVPVKDTQKILVDEQETTIKELIVKAQGYKLKLTEKEEELKKSKEFEDYLNSQMEAMKDAKKASDRDMIAEKQRYLTLYDEGISRDMKFKNEIKEKVECLQKLELELQNLKNENAELSNLVGEMDDLKADNIHLTKEVEMLNRLVNELNRAAVKESRTYVHDAIPLNAVKQAEYGEKKPATRGRGRPNKNGVDEKKQFEQEANQQKRKQVTPSSMTRRVKGRRCKEVSGVEQGERLSMDLDVILNKQSNEETRQLRDPTISRLWKLISEEIRAKLLLLHHTADRSTQVWESEDSSGKLFITVVLIEDLYTGAWISTDTIDWYFRWRIPNLYTKYAEIRHSQMAGCFALRSGCYTQWNSDVTGGTGVEMIRHDITSNLTCYTATMFVPMLCSQSHWTMLMLDIDHMQWYQYNSLHMSDFQLDEYKIAADSFRKHLQKILMPKIRAVRKDSSLVFEPDLLPESGPLQENGSDCGLFVCKFAEHKIIGASYIWNQRDVEILRAEFITNIMSTEGMSWNPQLLIQSMEN